MNLLQKFIIELKSLDPDSDYLVPDIYDLLEPIEDHPNIIDVVEEIFEFMENSPDSDLGAPGPLVHLLEKTKSYENFLYQSIKRKPVFSTVTMLSRRLNSPDEVTLLKSVLNHPEACEEVKKQAKESLDFQGEA